MAPTVPRLTTPRTQTNALPVGQALARPTGAQGIAETGKAIGILADTVAGSASHFKDLAFKAKQEADDTASMEAYAKLQTKANELYYNQEDGVVTRLGKNAFGVSEEYGEKFDDYADEVINSLTNDTQKIQAAQMRTKLRVSFDEQLQRHTAQETVKFEDETAKAAITASQQDAILDANTTPGKVEESIQLQAGVIYTIAERRGLGKEWADLEVSKQVSATQAGVVQGMLSRGKLSEANEYFKNVKTQITDADTRDRLEKTIDDRMFQNFADVVWSKVGNLKLSDGNADTEKMFRTIDRLEGIEAGKREKLKSEIKTRATEQDQFKQKREAAGTTALINKVLKMKADGQTSLDAARKTIPSFGGNLKLQHERQEIVDKIFTTDIKTDYEFAFSLWEKIKEGEDVSKDLFTGLRGERISGHDMMKFQELMVNEKLKSQEKEKDYLYTTIKNDADSIFPNSDKGKKEKKEFLGFLRLKTLGKSAEESQKISEDLLKKQREATDSLWWDLDRATGNRIPDFIMDRVGYKETPVYKTEAENRQRENTATGVMHELYGEKVTKALGGPLGIDSKLKELGFSSEQLKSGAPANNAVLYLLQKGLPVTRKNVDAVLKMSKSGKIGLKSGS